MIETPESICILRLSALGDVTHMVPVLRTLQKVWPQTRLTWIIGSLEARLLGDLPGVEFIVFEKSKGWRGILDLRRKLAGRRFDIFLHMQVALRANLASLAVRSPVRVGFDKARAKDYQWLFTNKKITARPKRHVLDGFFEFLEALGVNERHMVWDIPIPEAAAAAAKTKLQGKGPLLAINPCTSVRKNNWRNWSMARYAEVADYAAQTHGMRVVLTGGPAQSEREMAAEVSAAATAPIINLVGETNLKELLAVLREADVLVSPDTGPAHMGTAVGTPVIGLYATSNPRRTGPYLSLDRTVDRYPDALQAAYGLTEDQASWGRRVRTPDAMDLITVADVTAMLDKVMAQHGS